ncbi:MULTISPECIES: maleylpyruvate isomerase family mycothiol-dependent enzyme [unclassified Mycobacterium]|uniref:maleylpyruvate isomerase family mycothiol-dependent enzyme n=1 Tax=unclassified Mycobacterium TaxID=2642494 RepID=UPI0029C82616|nr:MULTISPECIES: maleylpyruvate isomerase family mycothiol-dependent enzyme [unclassified Mycobacterium]
MDRLAVIASESERLADVLAGTDPSRRCPTCPDWDASDLLWHLTEVHYFWAEILSRPVHSESELPDVERAKPARPTGTTDLLALRAQATTALVGQLAELDDSVPCWSWWPPDQTVGFTRRMQTYEATVHRVDAELTAGLPVSPIAKDVAAGAIDHAVDVMWGWKPDDATYRAQCVVQFVATDTDQRWLVEVGSWTGTGGDAEAPMAVRATHGDPTATVSAPVEELALWAWTRGGTADVTGQPESAAAVQALIAQGMQ